MEPLETLTAEQYGSWLVRSIHTAEDDQIRQELTEQYEHLVHELTYLERCLELDPYEANRSL